jgi:hypothetical protein
MWCACAVAACRGGERSVRLIDLVHDFPRAQKRPADAPFELAEHILSSTRLATIDAPVPSRITWTTAFPARALLNTQVAAVPAASDGAMTVTFRVGISDDRVYEPLAQQTVTVAAGAARAWTPLAADLSRYGGWQWSVFYRPDGQRWRLIFNADFVQGDGRALWGAPGIDADRDSAQRWWRRAAR